MTAEHRFFRGVLRGGGYLYRNAFLVLTLDVAHSRVVVPLSARFKRAFCSVDGVCAERGSSCCDRRAADLYRSSVLRLEKPNLHINEAVSLVRNNSCAVA